MTMAEGTGPRPDEGGSHLSGPILIAPLSPADVADRTEAIELTYARPLAGPVLVVDGYGLRIGVKRGGLSISDGVGGYRRSMDFPKVGHGVSRIVIVGGSTGIVTFDAFQLCRDLGISLIVLDRSGAPSIASVGYGVLDARLRRAQIEAAGTEVGVDIVRRLLLAKLNGHASIARNVLHDERTAEMVGGFALDMEQTGKVQDLRILEAQAAAIYWGAWPRVDVVRFISKDNPRVAPHWRRFDGRRSALRATGGGNQRASQPVNALLSYTYRLAELESRFALLAVGLDPAFGLLHADYPSRDSLALDLLEVARPSVEDYVLRLVSSHRFHKRDFVEKSDGAVRLTAPLTHQLAATMPLWGEAVAPHAEAIVHALADIVPGKVKRTTPLTSARRKAAQSRARPSRRRLPSPPLPFPVCAGCGVLLDRRDGKWCHDCLPQAMEDALSTARTKVPAIQERKRGAQAPNPSEVADLRARRRNTTARRTDEALAWDAAHAGLVVDPADFAPIQKALGAVTAAAVFRATGLSRGHASSIRRGEYVPHPRFWPVLARLGGVPCPFDPGDPPGGVLSLDWWFESVLPALARVAGVEIQRATGLSAGSASNVRRGLQVPNPKLWVALAGLASVALPPGGAETPPERLTRP